MKIFVPILVFLLAFSSCKSTKDTTSSNNSLIELEGAFKVSMLNGADVSDKGLTFILNESTNRVSGNSGCNTYGGNYELSETNDSISFSMIFASKKYCTDQEKNNIEREFLSLLSQKLAIVSKKESIELEGIENNSLKITLVKD